MKLKSIIKGTIKNIKSGSSEYSKNMEAKDSATSSGKTITDKSIQQSNKFKSTIKSIGRGIASTTGSIVRRITPSRTITIKKK